MKIILLFLTILFIFINIATLDGNHNWGDDFSAYISQAKALIDGSTGSFVDASNFRASYSEMLIGPNWYPWGYPLFLAQAVALFGVNIVALKFVTYLFFIGTLAVLYLLFRGKLKDEIILSIILVMAASPYFYIFKQNILADVPAMFLLVLSVLLIQKIYFEGVEQKRQTMYLVLLGVSIYVSIFVKTNSAILIPLLFLIQLIERKKWFHSFSDILYNAVPYLITLGIYFLTLFIFPQSLYENAFILNSKAIWDFVTRNSYYYAVIFSEIFGDTENVSLIFGAKSLFLFHVAYIVSIVLFLLGFFINFRKNYLYALFLLLTLGLFLVYPYQQGLRYVISLVPFFLFFAVLGLQALNFKKITKILSAEKVIYILSFVLVIFFSFQISALARNSITDGPLSKSSKDMFNYVKENISETEAVSFFKPRAMNLFSGRKSIYIGTTGFLKKSSVDYYVLVKDVDKKDMEIYLNKNGKLVFSNEQFQIYDLR